MGIFAPDGKLAGFLNALGNLIVLNILTLICSIPIFTFGASMTALYTMVMRMARKEDGKIISKKPLKLPREIKNIIRCKNPRCITSIEQGLDHIFVLTDEENQVYRCKYCEEKYQRN